MIPLLHDFADETVLVFGGGSVGARKARRFAREANVVVISPVFAGDVSADDTDGADPEEDATDGANSDDSDTDGANSDEYGGAALVRAAPGPGDVPGWFDRADPALAVAATDDAGINDAIERVARERGVLVNRADQSGGRDPGSVVVPATVRDDPVVAAVATGGRSPALSRYVRERIESEIENAGAMADLTADIRRDLRESGVEPDERRDAVRAVVRSERVWKALDSRNSNPRQVAADVIADATGVAADARDGRSDGTGDTA